MLCAPSRRTHDWSVRDREREWEAGEHRIVCGLATGGRDPPISRYKAVACAVQI